MRTLIMGSTGDDVRLAQEKLNLKINAGLVVDGSFGLKTRAAVIQEQTVNGITPNTGICGPKTWAALLADSQAMPTDQPAPWMLLMQSHLHEPEVTGAKPTPFDIAVFSHTDYGTLIRMDEGCAATVCWALEESGYKSSHNAAAISLARIGTPCELKFGAIVVLAFSASHHHVTFCYKINDDGTFVGLGGNQHSELDYATYERVYIIAIHWPDKAA